jgi:hypothetical protein
MTEPKNYVRSEPVSKDKLREMLAQAVRNTQPELNRVQAVPVSQPEEKRRGRPTTPQPAKRPAKARKGRA